MAWGEQINREGDISLRQVFAMLNDPDTRRGIMLLLRVYRLRGNVLMPSLRSAILSVLKSETAKIGRMFS